jgi:hypothetical protein
MTTKAESNEQMNTLIRSLRQPSRLRLVSENGKGRIVATEPDADDTKGDEANVKGAGNDDT